MNQEVHFTNIRSEIIKLLRECETELKIAVAWFTDEKIISEISKLVERGIKVSIIIYDDSINNKKLFENLHYQNVKIFLSKKLMHNKFCIIDDKIIINGSYNWTLNANSNDENIQVTYGNILLVEKFDEQFKKLSTNCKTIDEHFKYSFRTFEELDFSFSASYFSFPKYKFPYFLDCTNVSSSGENNNLKINESIYLIKNKEEEKKMQWYCYLLNTEFSITNILKIKQQEFLLPSAFDFVHDTRYDKNNVWEFKNLEYVVEVSKRKKHLGGYISNKYLFAIDATGSIVSEEFSFSKKISSNIYFGGSVNNAYFINKNLVKTKINFEIENSQNEDLFIVKNINKYGLLNKYNEIVIPIQFDDIPEKHYKFNEFIDFVEYPLLSFNISSDNIRKPFIHIYNIYRKEYNVDITIHRYSREDFKLIKTFVVKGKDSKDGYYFISDENYKYEKFYNRFKEFKFESTVHKLDKVNTSLTLKEFNELKSFFNDEHNLRKCLNFYFGERISLQYKKISEERKKKEGCYVATMVYKSYDHPDVIILRNFRDYKLKCNYFGRRFIKIYYKYSPIYVKYTEEKKALNYFSKLIISILVILVKMHFGNINKLEHKLNR